MAEIRQTKAPEGLWRSTSLVLGLATAVPSAGSRPAVTWLWSRPWDTRAGKGGDDDGPTGSVRR